MLAIKTYIESLVNSVTMYLLVCYSLIAVAIVALLLSAIGELGLSFTGLVCSLSILVVASYMSSRLFAWTFSTRHNRESWLITALILFFIIPPALSVQQYIATALIVFGAHASKYLLVVHARHVFNPAAIAALVFSLVGYVYSIWWVATPLLLPVVAVAGILIVAKTRRYAMVGVFLIISLLVSVIVGIIEQSPVTDSLSLAVISGPLIFFATVMLTEPLTSPTTRNQQYIYAAIVAVLYSSHLPWIGAPAAALIVGNLYVLLAHRTRTAQLTVTKVDRIGRNIYEIVATSTRPLHYTPGQYAELNVPHQHQDAKGMRRTFSFASAPEENQLRFGIKADDHMSSFKQALLTAPNLAVRTTTVGGDFTLTSDNSQPLLFVAGGIGVTPFRSMISHLLAVGEKRNIVLIYSAGSRDEFVYEEIFKKYQKNSGMRFIRVVTHPDARWSGETGQIDQTFLDTHVSDLPARLIYISGPPGFVATIQRSLLDSKISSRQIKTDYFTGY